MFTSKKVEDEYIEFVDARIAEQFDHPGNLRGTNEYAECRLAVQLGSSHHGDHEIRRRAAWLNEAVEPAAMKTFLTETYPGIVSSSTYLPESVIEDLQEQIDTLEGRQLSDVNPIQEDYGVGQDALAKIGYSVQYISLNQDEATITKP